MTERTRIEKVEFYKDLKTRTPGLVAGEVPGNSQSLRAKIFKA